MSSSKPQDWNKWMLLYNGADTGIEYLSQSEHDAFINASEASNINCRLKDGRLLPIMGGRLRPNPEWVDPVKAERNRKLNDLEWEYRRGKKAGRWSSIEEFKEFKKGAAHDQK